MPSTRVLFWLLAAALLLPILLVLLMGLATLLALMQDDMGYAALRAAVALGATLWVFDLVVLVVVLAVRGLVDPERRRGDAP